jgi:nickel transport protein
MIRSLFLFFLLSLTSQVFCHGLGVEIDRQEAGVIWLHHDDDTPLSHVEYELSVAGANTPYQTGQTDALGRVVFIPGDVRQWRLRVFSQDGHGIDRTFELTPGRLSHTHTEHSHSTFTKLILGIGILLSGFGIIMLFVKRGPR